MQLAGQLAEGPQLGREFGGQGLVAGLGGAPQAGVYVDPAVGGAGHELLDHAGDGVALGAAQVEHAEQGRGAAKAGARGQEPADLDVGVGARLEAAVQLQDRALAEDDRRVALLGADDPGRQLAEVREVRERLELPADLLGRRAAATGEAAAELAAKLGALDRVVDQAVAEVGEHEVGGRLTVGLQRERQLVVGDAAVGEAHLDAGQGGRLLAGGQRRDLGDLDVGDLAALGAEPPPGREEARERPAVERGEGLGGQRGGGHGVVSSWAFSVLSRRNHRNA